MEYPNKKSVILKVILK